MSSDAEMMRARYHGMIADTGIAVMKIVDAVRIFGEVQGTLLELHLLSNEQVQEMVSLIEAIKTSLDLDMANIGVLTGMLVNKRDSF